AGVGFQRAGSARRELPRHVPILADSGGKDRGLRETSGGNKTGERGLFITIPARPFVSPCQGLRPWTPEPSRQRWVWLPFRVEFPSDRRADRAGNGRRLGVPHASRGRGALPQPAAT